MVEAGAVLLIGIPVGLGILVLMLMCELGKIDSTRDETNEFVEPNNMVGTKPQQAVAA